MIENLEKAEQRFAKIEEALADPAIFAKQDSFTALMKERSPSCGSGTIYDGSFTGKVIPGDGVAAEKLRAAGLSLYGESEIEKLI